MSDKTGIEWTRGDDGTPGATWNPVTGCTKISAGCDNCYALTFAERWRGTPGHYFENGFDVQLRPDKLEQPFRWTRPRRVFVNSMSDLFHKNVPYEYIVQVFAVMAQAPQHTFQLLTKRHARMRNLLSGWGLRADVEGAVQAPLRWPLPNVWLGVSTEDPYWAARRIPALLDTPAAVRFISAEPLLGPLHLETGNWISPAGGGPKANIFAAPWKEPGPSLDWVIIGGESGPGARRMAPGWARYLVGQCQDSGVPVFVKQLGSVLGRELGAGPKGGDMDAWPEDLRVRQFPRAAESVAS